MPTWTTACLDWGDRLKTGRAIIPPPIFPAQAEEALAIFRELRIVDAPGSPTFGEACEQWVFDLVASVFGAYDAESGRRLITEWFVCLPKKNSKSTLAAGIMMTAVILNWRQSAEFAILAPTIEIAKNSYNPARDMCSERVDEELSALMQAQDHVKQITNLNSNAFLKVVAADSATVGGKKSAGVLIDELWLFGKQPDAANMLREATGGLASRPEGFVIYLTTQSDDPPAGVFKQKLDYARRVRDGEIHDPKFVPVIYEFPPDMLASGAYRDAKNFHIVNPNWGRSVDAEYIEREYSKALETGEDEVRGFLAKHGNVEIGMALRADRWPGANFWESCAGSALSLEDLIQRCDVVTVGGDGGGLDDMLGFAAIGREKKTKKWLLWVHAWIHTSVLELRKSEAARFADFSKQGDLTIVDRMGDDVEEFAALVAQIHAAGLLDKVGLDPAGIGAVLEALVDAGVPEDKIVGISQGWRLGGAIKTMERKLAEGGLIHGGQPLMTWCVGNAKVEQRANSILITKQASGTAKIDPLMASFDAVSLMALNPSPPQTIYDGQLLVV